MAGPPKPLQFPVGQPPHREHNAGTPAASAPPAPLSLGQPAQAPNRAAPPPPLNLPLQAPTAPTGQPRTLNLGNQPPHTQDALKATIEQIVATDPNLANLRHRLRPRLEQLQGAQEALLLSWGEQNLAVAAAHSGTHAALSQRVAQLDAPGWIAKCHAASTKQPGMLDFLRQQETPDHYANRFRQLQAELGPLIVKTRALIEEVQPELEDLRLDAVTLAAVAPRYTDPTLAMIINNRHRTLVAGQQTAAQLVQSAENILQVMVQNCQTMDTLLSVTIPAWRLARSS